MLKILKYALLIGVSGRLVARGIAAIGGKEDRYSLVISTN